MLQRSANQAWIDALCDLTYLTGRLVRRKEVKVIMETYAASFGGDVGISTSGFTIAKEEQDGR
jgi:hypothetical protein